MELTPAQLATLKADILANTTTIPAGQPWSGAFVGGEKGVLYKLGLNATLSSGRVLTIQARLQLIPDYY